MTHIETTASNLRFTALQYVIKKLFIAQVALFQCVKIRINSIQINTNGIFFSFFPYQHSLPISTNNRSPDIVLLKQIVPPDTRNILSADIEMLRSCSG